MWTCSPRRCASTRSARFLGDDAAIVKAQRLRRMFADQTDRLRQGEGVILGVGDAECGIQQAGGVVVGRENVEQTVIRQLVGGDVAGVGTAAHDIRRPIRTCIPC